MGMNARSRNGLAATAGREYQQIPEDIGEPERTSDEAKKQRSFVPGISRSSGPWNMPVASKQLLAAKTLFQMNSRKVLGLAILILVVMLVISSLDTFVSGETALRVVVLTSARPLSFKRLIKSLQSAHYNGDRIDLEVYISPYPKRRMGRTPVDQNVVEFAQGFRWDHGSKVVRVYDKAMDMTNHILHQTEEDGERILFLQDSVQLSPYYWQWLKVAHKTYGKRVDTAGFTLTRMRQRRRHKYMKSQSEVFMSPLVEHMVAYSPVPRHWKQFKEWGKEYIQRAKSSGRKRKKSKHFALSAMHLKYAFNHKDKQTIFANLPNKKSLASHFSENNSVMGRRDFEILSGEYASLLKFPAEPPVVAPTGQIRYYYEHPEMFPSDTETSADTEQIILTPASDLEMEGVEGVAEDTESTTDEEPIDPTKMETEPASSEDPDFSDVSPDALEDSDKSAEKQIESTETVQALSESNSDEVEPHNLGKQQRRKRKVHG